MRSRLAFCACALSVAVATRAEAETGLLPVEGDQAAAALLNTLPRRLAERHGIVVLAPAALQARLARAPEGTETAVQAVAGAERKLLEMDRRGASAEARRALRLLASTGGRYHSPRLLGRAHLALARALLLKPADVEGARAALGSALRAGAELDEAALPRRVADLLAQVRRDQVRAAPPAEELGLLCRRARLTGLVWIAARSRGAEVELELQTFEASPATRLRQLRQNVASERLLEETAALVASLLGAPGSVARPRPWYRKWWIWTIAAAVVAGSVTAAVVATSNRGSDGFSFKFRFE